MLPTILDRMTDTPANMAYGTQDSTESFQTSLEVMLADPATKAFAQELLSKASVNPSAFEASGSVDNASLQRADAVDGAERGTEMKMYEGVLCDPFQARHPVGDYERALEPDDAMTIHGFFQTYTHTNTHTHHPCFLPGIYTYTHICLP